MDYDEHPFLHHNCFPAWKILVEQNQIYQNEEYLYMRAYKGDDWLLSYCPFCGQKLQKEIPIQPNLIDFGALELQYLTDLEKMDISQFKEKDFLRNWLVDHKVPPNMANLGWLGRIHLQWSLVHFKNIFGGN